MKSHRRGNQTHTLAGAIALMLFAALSAGVALAQDRDRQPAMLTDEDINLIEVYEVHLDAEKPPKIKIEDKALREFLKEYQNNDKVPRGKEKQRDWLRGEGKDQLALMFAVQARDYYKHARVTSPIESLRAWRGLHDGYVLKYFQDHFGTGKVKGLYLFPRGQDSKRIEMTNFYILTQTQINGRWLIDRFNPADSLLLQWGLPREDAKFPAPEIDGWRPYFRDAEDRRFEELVEWIKSLIAENQRSDYGINYKLPGQEKEAQPQPRGNN